MRLTETTGADPRLGIKLRSVDRQVGRLTTLINDLLDVTRFTSGRLAFQPEPLDVATLAAEVVEQFREEALRAGITIALDASPAPGRWDRSRLDQVLTNLLTNAIKFGAGRPIEVAVRGQADTVRLTVTDHGIGIAPDDQAIIFDRFERAVSARNYGGFGLGLWIVHQIVTAMGGTITVDSVVGQGSTFTVILPQQPPEAMAPTA
jgi:signal transduction histidine kinase